MEDNENINNDDLMNSSMFASSGGEEDASFDSIFAETPKEDDSANEISSMFEDNALNSEEKKEEKAPLPQKEVKKEAKEKIPEAPVSNANLFKEEENEEPKEEEPKETPLQVIEENGEEEDFTNEKPTDVVTVRPVRFKKFEETPPIRTIKKNLDIMQDVSMHISVELGRTKSSIKEVMDFHQGSIVELNKIAGEQVEVFVNGKLVAKGEVIVIEDRFGVRITSTNVSKTAIP